MFGRVRASPSPSLDSFETPPSKIIKDDSLSIYETTLMKLKLGSKCHPISPVDLTDSYSRTITEACQEMHSDGESMVIDTDCSSDCQSTGDSKLNSQQRSSSTSILHLFSKFNSRQRTPTISDEILMIDINGSASSIEFQSLSSAKEGNHESSRNNGSTIT
ncbi:Nucleoside diphosphate kinase 2, IA IA,NDPK IA,ATNDPK2 [Hibiscus syriacus]|uniref:Nucleoside diphosphate kinase 2, IA IA,NDPK IA,ATNDPK2 n=1 Tax=Hibiscus syriacus TaxID=106335 RepID=A0A6A2XZ57_HIBSY|nr:uncharacterized protein LOC120178572 [Hibiscus syriacus]KAE8667936.1 Nucleoside diphosphate kinase 2, IA IA,NDPK IA,ATNDPK2 [Hibiscus syriacus]